ncbi:uncharacterized protein RCO7_14787 [Rhynchosporium graminicola]|uniref:Uncharacterized protein n=1 Tax=Rhynchosporium graminicola TaxID=2792576 RepID=A0A1E1L2J9_9HELO|nr:uncharacterized protein RCO7_14787 [Rhynchosporium commune]
MGSDLESIASFCNYSDNPLPLTLPIKYCKHSSVCEEVLIKPYFIATTSILGLFMLIFMLWAMHYWTMETVADKLVHRDGKKSFEWFRALAHDHGRGADFERQLERGRGQTVVLTGIEVSQVSKTTIPVGHPPS